MKHLFLILSLTVFFSSNAQIYKAKKDQSSVHFFSKASLEDIEAINKSPIIMYKVETADFQSVVVMDQFKFKAALMEEHFRENYVETEKYPNATFKGKVNEKVDLSKDGENKVTVTGKMTLHGVTKDMTADGTITKKGEELIIHSVFKLKIADYNIKVPSLYVQNIAEVVDVTVHAVMEPYVKK